MSDDELAERVIRQIERLEKARAKATRLLLETDDDRDLLAERDRIDRELGAARNREQALKAMRADAADTALRLTDLVQLAQRAATRLKQADASMQRQVLSLLDVRVSVTDISDANAPGLLIEGRIDSRLFGAGGPEGVEPRPAGPLNDSSAGTHKGGPERPRHVPDVGRRTE